VAIMLSADCSEAVYDNVLCSKALLCNMEDKKERLQVSRRYICSYTHVSTGREVRRKKDADSKSTTMTGEIHGDLAKTCGEYWFSGFMAA